MRSINVERWKKMNIKMNELKSRQRKAQDEVGKMNHAIYDLSMKMGAIARQIHDEGSDLPWLNQAATKRGDE